MSWTLSKREKRTVIHAESHACKEDNLNLRNIVHSIPISVNLTTHSPSVQLFGRRTPIGYLLRVENHECY